MLCIEGEMSGRKIGKCEQELNKNDDNFLLLIGHDGRDGMEMGKKMSVN